MVCLNGQAITFSLQFTLNETGRFRELSATVLSLKNVRNMKMAPLRISSSAFSLIRSSLFWTYQEAAWRGHAYMRAEEAFGRLSWASSKVNLGIITEFATDSLPSIITSSKCKTISRSIRRVCNRWCLTQWTWPTGGANILVLIYCIENINLYF